MERDYGQPGVVGEDRNIEEPRDLEFSKLHRLSTPGTNQKIAEANVGAGLVPARLRQSAEERGKGQARP